MRRRRSINIFKNLYNIINGTVLLYYFYIDLSRYGGHEVQQKQVNCVCKVQKQDILAILLQSQKICYKRGEVMDSIFHDHFAWPSPHISSHFKSYVYFYLSER